MSAHTKLSPAKAERVKALAAALARAAENERDARFEAEVMCQISGLYKPKAMRKALQRAESAVRMRDTARAALIRECEAPDQEGGGA